MKTSTASLGLALCLSLLPISSLATTSTAKKAAAPTVYECTKCHMKYSAAMAKKDHYKDAMDGGTLVPVKTAPKAPRSSAAATKPKTKSASMSSMGM